VVADGCVYFMSAHGNNSYFTTYALSTASGIERWRFTPQHSNVSSSLSVTAPAVVGGAVYFAVLDSPFSSSADIDGGLGSNQTSSSQMQQHDVVQLYALDGATGATLWISRMPNAGQVTGPPVVAHGLVYLALGDGAESNGALFAVDAASGAVKWTAGNVSATFTSPAVGDGLVFVSGTDGGLHAFDAASGTWRWTTAAASNQWASPVVDEGGRVFSATGNSLLALNSSAGGLLWRASIPMYNPLTPAVAAGRVFISGTTTTLFAFNASTGSPLWNASNLCSVHLWSVPVVGKGATLVSPRIPGDQDRRGSNGIQGVNDSGMLTENSGSTVYVGSDVNGQLIALDAASGARQWAFTASDAVRSPALGDGLVFFGVNQPWGVGSSDSLVALVA